MPDVLNQRLHPPLDHTERISDIMRYELATRIGIALYHVAGKVLKDRGLRGRPALLRLDQCIRSKLILRETNVGGHKMYLDDRDSLCLSLEPGYDSYQNEILDLLVPRAGVVLDIGANIGFNTLRFARAVGEAGRVFAFEPEASNLALLRKNVLANGYQNVAVIPKAVADIKGTARLFVSEVNRGDHQLYSTSESRVAQDVEITTVDDEFRNLERIHAVKMDIQGSESRAFLGMRGLLERSRCVYMVTEFWPLGLLNAGSSAEHFFGQLQSAGFSLYEIDQRRRQLPAADLNHLLSDFPPKRGSHTNLLAVKGPIPEAVARIIGKTA